MLRRRYRGGRAVAEESPWPRVKSTYGHSVTLHLPQVEAWTGNWSKVRAVVEAKLAREKPERLGVTWCEAQGSVDRSNRIVSSGDLSPRSAPILKAFEPFKRADVICLESTYGDHDDRRFDETVEEFVRPLKDTVEKSGKILVPIFAVGSPQSLTGLLAWMFGKKKVRPFPIFLHSPMVIEATAIYAQHRELFNDAITKFVAERPLWADLMTMKLYSTAEDSLKTKDEPGRLLVMAVAGVCEQGASHRIPKGTGLMEQQPAPASRVR